MFKPLNPVTCDLEVFYHHYSRLDFRELSCETASLWGFPEPLQSALWIWITVQGRLVNTAKYLSTSALWYQGKMGIMPAFWCNPLWNHELDFRILHIRVRNCHTVHTTAWSSTTKNKAEEDHRYYVMHYFLLANCAN